MARKAKAKAPRGRPSTFNDRIRAQIIMLAETGRTLEQIANDLSIPLRTLKYWKQKNKGDLLPALKAAGDIANQLVEASLLRRALGYYHAEEQIFCAFGKVTRVKTVKHYPPDSTAMIFWLKNRDPERWREKPPEPAPAAPTGNTETVYETEWGGSNEPVEPGDV